MTIDTRGYGTTANIWREEFERSYLDWLNLNLIKGLLNSINCSDRFLSDTIRDTSRTLSKINSSLKTMNYRHVRNTADFLGVPPWLLFYHEDRNEKLRQLFEIYPSILKPIQIPYFSEYKENYSDFFYELSKRVKTSKDYDLLEHKLNEIIGHNYHDVIEGNWKAIFSFLAEIYREFSGGAKFSYIINEVNYTGALRVSFFENQRNPRELIKTAWLVIEVEQMTNLQQQKFDEFILKVKSDMEWIIDQPPWEFFFETKSKHLKLIMWHSLRTPQLSQLYYNTVGERINPLLPDLNYSVNVGLPTDNIYENLNYISLKEQLAELIELLKEDVPQYYSKNMSKRRFSTLSLLYEKGLIQTGDPIVFIDGKVSLDTNDPRLRANIVIENDKILVKWDYDGNIYSISGLTKDILTRYGMSPNYKLQPNGNHYWRLIGDQKSLFKKALGVLQTSK